MSQKVCLFCEHFVFDMGWGGSGETPGDSAEVRCGKGHWRLGMYDKALELREGMRMAETCGDYEEGKSLDRLKELKDREDAGEELSDEENDELGLLEDG